MKKKNILICFLFVFLLASLNFFFGCSSESTKGATQAEILYKEAKELMDDGRYMQATEKLNLIKSQHPYSYYATHAEMMLADILYAQENFVEAAASYILFKDFHPKHKDISYVVWKIAESYYNQLPSTFDRDLAPAIEAMKYYNDLIANYPDSANIEDAKKKIEQCQKLLRDKEKYIADFYFKTKIYDAARFRYLEILKMYANDPEMVNYSIVRIVESSYKFEDFEGCIKYADEFTAKTSGDFLEKISDLKKSCQKKLDEQQKENKQGE